MAHRGAGITRNDRRILALKNRHRGQLCVLVGNGPSVRIEDIEKLKDCVTFCCNRFYLAYEQHPEMTFRPTYTISADQTMMDDFGEEMEAKCESTLFLVSNETIRLPGDYAGDPVFKYDYTTTVFGYSPHTLKLAVATISETEAVSTKAFDTIITDVVHGDTAAADRLCQDDVDFSTYDDDMAADDLVAILFGRDGTAGGDVGDMKFLGGVFEYTVS